MRQRWCGSTLDTSAIFTSVYRGVSTRTDIDLATLAKLICSLFSNAELRQFVGSLANGKRLSAELPGDPISLRQLASNTVGLLSRHGMIDAAFFDALKKERPGRARDIDSVQAGLLKSARSTATMRIDLPSKNECRRLHSQFDNFNERAKSGPFAASFISSGQEIFAPERGNGRPGASCPESPMPAILKPAPVVSPQDDFRGNKKRGPILNWPFGGSAMTAKPITNQPSIVGTHSVLLPASTHITKDEPAGDEIPAASPAHTVTTIDDETSAPEPSQQEWLAGVMAGGTMMLLIAALAAVVIPSSPQQQPPSNASDPAPKPTKATLHPILIPLAGGTFWMGSPESVGDPDERPRHQQTVDQFAICKTEVTQRQWQRVMGSNAGNCKHGCGRDLPVQNVSWHEAVEYLNKLSVLKELTPCYRTGAFDTIWDRQCTGFRLPTEAEWEYAARAGTDTEYSFGDEGSKLQHYAWYQTGLDDHTSTHAHEVAMKEENGWGLYDMHGNVSEWVWDRYGIYGHPRSEDGGGHQTSAERVIRGGSFNQRSDRLRSANRNASSARNFFPSVGFRCARSLSAQ